MKLTYIEIDPVKTLMFKAERLHFGNFAAARHFFEKLDNLGTTGFILRIDP